MNNLTEAETVAALLHATTDAHVWASEFNLLFPDSDIDTMLGWFANAIETGRSAGLRSIIEDGQTRIKERLDRITDVGIYPTNDRTPWQEGWNAACIAIAERLDADFAI